MTESKPKKKTRLWLSSMVFAIVLMLLLAIFMLAGVLPVPNGNQSVIFQTPVFITLILLLVLSSGICALKRKFTLRSLGFHITHLAVVVFAVGAMMGFLKEERATIQIYVNQYHPVSQVQSENGEIIDLGFTIVAKDFHVDKYPPNLHLYHKEKLVRKIRMTEKQELDLSPCGAMTVETIVPNAKVTDAVLSGPRELVIYDNDQEWKRVNLETLTGDIPLPGQSVMKLIRMYNNVPQMQMGETYQETVLPSRPGIIAEVTEENKRAVISVIANEEPKLLSRIDPEECPDIPAMSFEYPPLSEIKVISAPGESIVSAAILKDMAGNTFTLLQEGGYFSYLPLKDEWILEISSSADKHYKAKIEVTDPAGKTTEKQMTVNKPVDHNGWRFYLNSYDRNHQSHITLTARRDPGDKFAVTGIIALIIGIALIFYVRPNNREKKA